MPNFTIRRRKPKRQPVPTQPPPPKAKVEEKVDETEMSYSESSAEDYIDAAMEDLQITPNQQAPRRPQHPPPPQYRPQKPVQTQPQYVQHARVVEQPQKTTSFDKHFGPTPHINDPYRRKPTMRNPYSRPKQPKGGAKMRFRSHYGAGAEHMDTRTKSLMLLNHCFG